MELTVESLDSPALTKAQLADLLFDEIGLNKRESKEMVDAFFELISQSLVEGEDVKLSGFGNFQIRTKAPRPGAIRARGGDSHRGTPCCHLPCQQQAQGADPGRDGGSAGLSRVRRSCHQPVCLAADGLFYDRALA